MATLVSSEQNSSPTFPHKHSASLFASYVMNCTRWPSPVTNPCSSDRCCILLRYDHCVPTLFATLCTHLLISGSLVLPPKARSQAQRRPTRFRSGLSGTSRNTPRSFRSTSEFSFQPLVSTICPLARGIALSTMCRKSNDVGCWSLCDTIMITLRPSRLSSNLAPCCACVLEYKTTFQNMALNHSPAASPSAPT